MSDPEDPGGDPRHRVVARDPLHRVVAGDPLHRVVVADEQNLPVDSEWIASLARHALVELGIAEGAELSVVLATPERMAALKGRYLGEEVPTDVLAFPMDGANASDPGPQLLGDVVLCPAVAQRQAAEAGHSAEDELGLLLVHGILHLLDHDHAEHDDAAIMRAEERRILGSWGRR